MQKLIPELLFEVCWETSRSIDLMGSLQLSMIPATDLHVITVSCGEGPREKSLRGVGEPGDQHSRMCQSSKTLLGTITEEGSGV